MTALASLQNAVVLLNVFKQALKKIVLLNVFKQALKNTLMPCKMTDELMSCTC